MEADFLAKMQDADSGFYFLVYLAQREYENDVRPKMATRRLSGQKTRRQRGGGRRARAMLVRRLFSKNNFRRPRPITLRRPKLGWRF